MLQPQGKLCVEAVLGGQNPAQLLQAIQDQGLQVGWGGGAQALWTRSPGRVAGEEGERWGWGGGGAGGGRSEGGLGFRFRGCVSSCYRDAPPSNCSQTV